MVSRRIWRRIYASAIYEPSSARPPSFFNVPICTIKTFCLFGSRANLGEQQCCSRIVFVWAVRDAGQYLYTYAVRFPELFPGLDHISWISEPLNRALQDIPASIAVDIRFYFTATAGDAQAWDDDAVESTEGGLEDPDAKASSSSQGSSSEPQVLDPDLVRVQQGRPDLAKILEEETGRAAGPISVNGGCLISL